MCCGCAKVSFVEFDPVAVFFANWRWRLWMAIVLPLSCAAEDYNGDQPGVSWTPRVLMQSPYEALETQVTDNESESN